MFRKLREGKRFEFTNDGYTHFVITNQELREDELNLLRQLLASFPHASNAHWLDKFLNLNTEISKKLRLLAANAYHEPRGYTVLGAAADQGEVEALQKLIDMGADLNAVDVDDKLALYWAIANRKSIADKKSLEAASVVKCLIDNGARTDITSYQNQTPLQYAESRGYEAAATIIKENQYCLNKQLVCKFDF